MEERPVVPQVALVDSVEAEQAVHTDLLIEAGAWVAEAVAVHFNLKLILIS